MKIVTPAPETNSSIIKLARARMTTNSRGRAITGARRTASNRPSLMALRCRSELRRRNMQAFLPRTMSLSWHRTWCLLTRIRDSGSIPTPGFNLIRWKSCLYGPHHAPAQHGRPFERTENQSLEDKADGADDGERRKHQAAVEKFLRIEDDPTEAPVGGGQ